MKSLLVLVLSLISFSLFAQPTGKTFADLPTMTTVDGTTYFVTLDGSPKVWKKFTGSTLKAYLHSKVTVIANLSALGTVTSPYEGDLVLNTNRDTLWIRGASQWYIFKTSTVSQTLQQVLAAGNSANSLKITNLGTPTNSTDAAHKQYVDNSDATTLVSANAYADLQKVTLRNSKPSPITTFTTNTVIDTVGIDSFYVWNNGSYKLLETSGGSLSSLANDTIYILVSGQSNAWGATGPTSVDTVQNSKVQVWNHVGGVNQWQTAIVNKRPFRTSGYNALDGSGSRNDLNGSVCPSWHFAKKLQEETKKVVRLVLAIGDGQNIYFWHDGTTKQRYLDSITTRSVAAGVKQYDAFIWAQGEADPAMSEANYLLRFDSILNQLKLKPYFPSTTPIIVCGMNTAIPKDSTLRKFDYNTNQWQAYAPVDGLPAYWDGIHWSGAGARTLGRERIWAAYNSLPKRNIERGKSLGITSGSSAQDSIFENITVDSVLFKTTGGYVYSFKIDNGGTSVITLISSPGGGSGTDIIWEALRLATASGNDLTSTGTGTNSDAFARSDKKITANGEVEWTVNNTAHTVGIGWDNNSTDPGGTQNYTNYKFTVYNFTTSLYYYISGAPVLIPGITVSVGLHIKIKRTGTAITVETSPDGTTWTVRYTTNTTLLSLTGDIYSKCHIYQTGNVLVDPKITGGVDY